MSIYSYIILFSIIFTIMTLYYAKIRALDFKYSLFWIFISINMFVFSLWRSLIEYIAGLLNIYYPPALLLLAGILLCFLLIFNIMLAVSSLQNKVTTLTQKLAILESMLNTEEK